jgi:NAD(P)-dependent dehydrogenase (short-subunit alcohol dehydrogenase family)
MRQLDGKVAIVTGGASGIGAACAETLAREGARVAVTDIDFEGARAVAGRITEAGGHAFALQHDVTDEDRWIAVMAEIHSAYGHVTTMVANAGIAVRGSITDMTLAEWRRQTAINVDGVFLAVKYCVPAMRLAGSGSIILMSSVAGLRGAAGLAGYSATKGAVRLYAKSVAMACAMANDKIRCNSVHPGIIETPIWTKMDGEADAARRNAPVDIAAMAAIGVPLGRVGQAQDIASGVLFLASDASSYMTGSELIIDGGMTGGAVQRSVPAS